MKEVIEDVQNATYQALNNLNCTIIGLNIQRIITGMCGNIIKVGSGMIVAVAITSVSMAFIILFVAIFNKKYSHFQTAISKRVMSPPSDTVVLNRETINDL